MIAGHPRRIPDYPDAYQGWNKVASLGSMISMVSIIIFLVGVYKTLTGPEHSPEREETRVIPFYNDNDSLSQLSGVRTLELALSTPPMYHHYDHLQMVNEVLKRSGEGQGGGGGSKQ